MTTGSNSKIQESQSKKSASYKRAHRANRPVLVTEQRGAELDQPTEQAEEVQQTENAAELAENTTTETVTRKRKPGFFLNIGKTESRSDQPAADPKAVHGARYAWQDCGRPGRGCAREETSSQYTESQQRTGASSLRLQDEIHLGHDGLPADRRLSGRLD